MYDPIEHEPRGPGFGPGGELIYQKSWNGVSGDYFAGMGYDYESFANAFNNMTSYRPPEAGYRFDDNNNWMTWKAENISSEDIEFTAVPVFTSGKGLDTRLVQIMYFEGGSFIASQYENGTSVWGEDLMAVSSRRAAFFEDGSSLSYGSEFARDLQSHYESGGGRDYVISRERLQHMFHQALENGAFNWQDAKQLGDNIFSVPTDFYKTSYNLSFGTATMNIFMDVSTGVVYPAGFSDDWNLDPKPWGARSYPAEILTRYYNWKLTGENFSIR